MRQLEINWEHMYSAVLTAMLQGCVVYPSVLTMDTCAGLLQLCDEAEMHRPRPSGVYQSFATHHFAEPLPEALEWLVERTESVARAIHARGGPAWLREWRVNDVAIQCYAKPWDMIGWHRDYKQDVYLVVVYTLAGESVTDVELHGRVVSWRVQAGSAMVLLGCAPGRGSDPRIRHRVRPPLNGQPRTSLALRMSVAELSNYAALAA